MKRILFVCAVVLPVLFATGCGCGCCRKGIVLRGDWSLELNRVPHMKSNGPTYQGDCDACDVGCVQEMPGGCVDGCTQDCTSSAGGRAGVSHRRGGELYDEFSDGAPGHMPEPPQPTTGVHPRFHPVPTKPVFEPDYGPELVPSVQPASATTSGWKSKRRA